MANWADLPNDVLRHLTSYLPFTDHHRFSCVCRNWRLVAKELEHRLPPQLPWLVLGEDPETKKRNFFDLSEQRPYSIDIPELYGQYICGSSHGWFFTIDIEIKCRLLNPFTRECVEMPPLPPHSHNCNLIVTEEPAVCNSKGLQIGYTFKEMQRCMIFKAVLSHDPRERSDFTVMIIFGKDNLLAIWRPGDTSWTIPKIPLQRDYNIRLSDVICFQGNFYAVSHGRHFFAVDVGSRPNMTRINLRVPNFGSITSERYMVDMKGELLLILRYKRNSRRKPRKEFRVIRLDLVKESWQELSDIDGLSLFIGNNSAVVVDPTIFPNCIENAIYFTDTCDNYHWEDRGHHFGVYDMIQESMGRFCLIDHYFLPPDAPLRWASPN